MSAPQFGKTSTSHDAKIATQNHLTAAQFTRKSFGNSSRKKRGTLHHCLSAFPVLLTRRGTQPSQVHGWVSPLPFGFSRSAHSARRFERFGHRKGVSIAF